MTGLATLSYRAGRCAHGYAPVQHPKFCDCAIVPALKAAGITAANDNADPDDKASVDAAIRALAATGRPFSANDMRHLGVTGPVVGGRFQAAFKARVIVGTGNRVVSNLASTNGHKIDEWIGVVGR